MLMERGTGRWDRLGEDQHRITAADMGALSWMHEHAQDWAPQKRGAAAVWSSGLQRHPKLGLGAAAASASPRGRWKKTQCRRAGELEDQSRKTEVSLATQGGNGTNSSTATRWIQAGLLQKLSKIYFGRVRYRQTAPEGLLWKHKAPPWIEIVLYK